MDTPDADGLLAEQLLRLTRRVHRIQKRQLEKRGLGITPAQSRLLRTLAHYGSPPRMADLAERLEVVPRAVTTLVDGLEASGKVRRVPDPTNRRVIRIELTDDGRGALRELRAARRTAAEDILAPLSDDQRKVLGGCWTRWWTEWARWRRRSATADGGGADGGRPTGVRGSRRPLTHAHGSPKTEPGSPTPWPLRPLATRSAP